MPLTNAERSAKSRQRRKESGKAELHVWIDDLLIKWLLDKVFDGNPSESKDTKINDALTKLKAMFGYHSDSSDSDNVGISLHSLVLSEFDQFSQQFNTDGYGQERSTVSRHSAALLQLLRDSVELQQLRSESEALKGTKSRAKKPKFTLDSLPEGHAILFKSLTLEGLLTGDSQMRFVASKLLSTDLSPSNFVDILIEAKGCELDSSTRQRLRKKLGYWSSHSSNTPS